MASLGITHGLQQATFLWMRKQSVVLRDAESLKWDTAFGNLKALFFAPAGAEMATQLADWERPKDKTWAAMVERAEYFFQRVMVDPADIIAVIMYASWRFEAIDAFVKGRTQAPGSTHHEWYRQEEAAGAEKLLSKVKLRAGEGRKFHLTQVYLCPGCSTSEPTSEDTWGPLYGDGAFDLTEAVPNVRALLSAPRFPPGMEFESESWRFGSFNPQVEILKRRKVREVSVHLLMNRERHPLTRGHIDAAEIIAGFARDARLPSQNVTRLLLMLADLKRADVLYERGLEANQHMPFIPLTADTLEARAALGDAVARGTVYTHCQAFCAVGIGQLQQSATLVSLNPLVALQEIVSDLRLKKGLRLERPAAASQRPSYGCTGPEYVDSQRCYDVWRSIPERFHYAVHISLWSDKTDVKAVGGAQYPLMMRIVNMMEDVSMKRSATRIIAIMPKVQCRLTHGGKKVRKTDHQMEYERQLIHDAFADALLPLEHAAEHGVWLELGGGRAPVLCAVRVSVFPADLAEKSVLTGMAASDHCAECHGPTLARRLGLPRTFLEQGELHSCGTAPPRTTKQVLLDQRNTLARHNLGMKGQATAASRERGMMTHADLRSAFHAMPHLFHPATGGLHGCLVFDFLHGFKLGVVGKFFKLLLPLCYLHYRVHDGGSDPEKAVKSPEDVQQLIEQKLAMVPSMRDGTGRRVQTLHNGWWTKSYWTGDDYAAFLQTILFALGENFDLIEKPEVRTCVLRTLRMLFKVYKLVTVRPDKYTPVFLADVDRTTRACLAGLAQMQVFLEGTGEVKRTEVCGQEWKAGADTIKGHAMSGLAMALLEFGSIAFTCTSSFEAQQAILKLGAPMVFSMGENQLVPRDLLINCYVNQVRPMGGGSSSGGDGAPSVTSVCQTRIHDPIPGVRGLGWAGACKLLFPQKPTSGAKLTKADLPEVVATCLGCATPALAELSYARCVALPNAVSTTGEKLGFVYLSSGECVLVVSEGLAPRVCRFIVAVGDKASPLVCVVQEFTGAVPGGAPGARDPGVGLPAYRLVDTYTRVDGGCLVRMVHMVPKGDGVFFDNRGLWHLGTRGRDAGLPRAAAFDDATALLEAIPDTA
jgi:hypothetical protein